MLIHGLLDDSLRASYQASAQRVGAKVVELTQRRKLEDHAPHAITETQSLLADWFAQHGESVAVVRPDHYVFGTAPSFEDGLALMNQRTQAVMR